MQSSKSLPHLKINELHAVKETWAYVLVEMCSGRDLSNTPTMDNLLLRIDHAIVDARGKPSHSNVASAIDETQDDYSL